jgi:hypothetical protein
LNEDKNSKRSGRGPGLPDPAPRQQGGTTVRRDRGREPRLPHEHDDSADGQAGEPKPVMRQAQLDIEHGLVDTDRTAPMEEVYDRELRSPSTGKPEDTGKREGAES